MEPGKTYFFLNDFETGQQLWMGDDVRVQNELMAHKRLRAEAKVPQTPDIDLMTYLARADSAFRVQMDYHRAMQQSHPTLSQRYLDYVAGYYRMDQATNMLEAQFFAKDFKAPREYVDYMNREFWQKPPKPYTIYRDFASIMHTYLNFTAITRVQENLLTSIKRFAEEGKLALTPAEQRALDDYPKEVKRVETETKAATTDEERKAKLDEAVAQRRELNAQLLELDRKRSAFLREAAEHPSPDSAPAAFDEEVLKSIDGQLKRLRSPAK